MNVRDAVQLIAPAVPAGGRWADLGAGRGTFTAALARLLGPGGTVYAIERDATAPLLSSQIWLCAPSVTTTSVCPS